MKSKQRLLAAIKGEPVDRMPWAPNLPYWWESQSDSIINRGEITFLKEIGADALVRGHYPYKSREWKDLLLFKTKFKNSNVRESINGTEKSIIYETPVGKLCFLYKYSDHAKTWFIQKHGVQSEEDFKTLAYLFEDIEVEKNYQQFEETYNYYGDEALLVANVAPQPNLKSSFQAMVEYWVGTEEIAYAVFDYPDAVEYALESMKKVSMRTTEISAQSKAEAFLSFEDTSTTNISPAFYEKFILPEINAWCDIVHQHGKIYMQHACGHLNSMIPLMSKSRIDAIESISPPPTGNIELWDAREKLQDHIALIGGIEPTVLLNSSIEELEDYTVNLLEKMKGTRYVLANSDSCPPGIEIEKFRLIRDISNRY